MINLTYFVVVLHDSNRMRHFSSTLDICYTPNLERSTQD